MSGHNSGIVNSGLDAFQALEPWRVSDAAFARAYSLAGDRGRALIKSAIAALFEAGRLGRSPSVTVSERLPSGLSHAGQCVSRPWYALILGPAAVSPAQVVAAVSPALARRIPVFVVRPKSRAGWPPAVLAALELAGVEQVFAPPRESFKRFLRELEPNGTLCCLGDAPFMERIRASVPQGCFFHWLVPPESAFLYRGPGVHWDAQTLAFSHAGLRFLEYGPNASPREACWAAFSPRDKAPQSARLVLEPGREALWDWPDMPSELFFSRRLIYS